MRKLLTDKVTKAASYPAYSFSLTSGQERTALEVRKYRNSQLFLVRNPEINMTSSETSLSSENDAEQQGVNFVLQVIGRENVTLKEKQM